VLTADDFPQIRAQGAPVAAIPQPSLSPASDALPDASHRLQAFGNDGHVRPLADVESDMIALAVRHYEGHLSEVARRLGIGRSTLYRKLAELGLNAPDGPDGDPL
jgi:DNA-binding NtrC family response regulator